MVQGRRNIHGTTPVRQLSNEEHDPILDNSQDTQSNESFSDVEEEASVPHSSNYCKNQENIETSCSVSRNCYPEKDKHVPPISKSTHSLKYVYIIMVIFVLVAIAVNFMDGKKENTCSFTHLKNQYPAENTKLWERLRIGIETVLNERTQRSAVYLFAHYGNQNTFQLIKDIAVHSSGCFGKEMVQMENDDFISTPAIEDDYGYAIQKYRNKIKKGNVILIANLNEIPAKAARAFQTICDTHTPIAKNVVIFLTLTIQPNKKGNANALAEETLVELWGPNLKRYELDPLITRVTDEVIILQS